MDSKKIFKLDPKLKSMNQIKQVLRYHHYAYRTEKTYCNWIVQYLKFYSYKLHPKDMGKFEIDKFLSHLATDRKVTASTQRQAFNSIVFLYKHVLDLPVSDNLEPIRAKKSVHTPVVMTQAEVT